MTLPALVLPVEQRRRLLAAAESVHPEECCGVLLGRATAGGRTIIEQVVTADNVSPGDRRRSFSIDPARVLEVHRRARAMGSRVIGFYHSHPEGAPRPSAHDARDAWPDMSYVILSPGGRITSWRRVGAGGLEAERLVSAGGEAAERPNGGGTTRRRAGVQR